MLTGETCCALIVTGGWDEALAMIEPIAGEETSGLTYLSNIEGSSVLIELYRGNVDAARARVDEVGFLANSADSQSRSLYWSAHAAVLHASGHFADAVTAGRLAMKDEVSTIPSFWVKEGFAIAAGAALDMGDVSAVEELLAWAEALPPGRRPPALAAQALRVRGRLAARSGQPEAADRDFARAIELFTSISASFWAASARVEWAEVLSERGAICRRGGCRGAGGGDAQRAAGGAVARPGARAGTVTRGGVVSPSASVAVVRARCGRCGRCARTAIRTVRRRARA